MSSQAVTLADVAVEAGVHPSTVSRVLSRPQLIGEPTRTAVHAAIHKLGYTPNRAARQLAGGRIGAIGVLVPDITNPFFAHVVRSVQQGCRRKPAPRPIGVITGRWATPPMRSWACGWGMPPASP